MPKGKPNRGYTPEFKIKVVETMHKEKLSYCEAARQFDVSSDTVVAKWERIYLEEGKESFFIERRGRKSTGRPPKLKKKVEEDLISEVQRLRAENSDQGWQYQHKHYRKMLADKGIRQSMSRKGNRLDNACAENFFSLLKTELLYLQEFTSVEHFIYELTEYIEWYNNKRIKLKLDGLSPVDYRLRAA